MPRAVLYGSRHYAKQHPLFAYELSHYAHAAERRNLRGFMVTCQDCMLGVEPECQPMSVETFAKHLDAVDRARRRWIDRVDVRLLRLPAVAFKRWTAGMLL